MLSLVGESLSVVLVDFARGRAGTVLLDDPDRFNEQLVGFLPIASRGGGDDGPGREADGRFGEE